MKSPKSSAARPHHIRIATDFSPTTGARSPSDGPFSGEEFLHEVLGPAFDRAVAAGSRLLVDLDGTQGYATSFLEAAFGGLVREHDNNVDLVLRFLELRTAENPEWLNEIDEYIRDAPNK